MRTRGLIAVVLLTLGLGGCSSGEVEREAEREQERVERKVEDPLPEVDWSKYLPQQKRIIDKAARQGDCQLLQDTFDVQANRVGPDPDILDYIDAQLEAAGCYE